MKIGAPAATACALPETARVAIVATRWNEDIVRPMLADALRCLAELGIRLENDRAVVVRVPGAFEIPLAAQRLATGGRYCAVIALGAVIRGDTPHFDFVAGNCAAGLNRVMLDTGVPVAFGVLTTDTPEQARQRADTKGREAAEAALEMAAWISGDDSD